MHKNADILTGRALSGLYAITDASLMSSGSLCAKVEAALRGGCRILQYRNKVMNVSEQKREAGLLRDLCDRYDSLLIINDHVMLAQDVGADGIHIGQSDVELGKVRKQVGNNMIIGVSCHNDVELAWQAQAMGANYVAFGRFFPSRSKPDAPAADLSVLRLAKRRLHIPVVAIGGITRDNAPRVIEQGADMVAVIHDLFSPDDLRDIEQRTHAFTQLFS